MSTSSKPSVFGQKGVRDRAMSVAEMLLTGNPVARAVGQTRIPKLKPRAKAVFGCKAVPAAKPRNKVKVARPLKWQFWALIMTTFLTVLYTLAGAFDWRMPTLGGRQLWTDMRVQGDWRTQCHAWTGHCRLLDANDIRHTWGRETDVLSAMNKLTLPPMRKHAVVLIHGLGRSAHSFNDMATTLKANGTSVVAFNYASTQGSIEQHAQALNRIVEGFDGVERVSFVTHSLGGIVLRKALALSPAWQRTMKQGPSVLLAAPNQGSQIANLLADYAAARWIFGPVLGELADAKCIKQLPSPKSFATVAGTRNLLWFFDDESDGLVREPETQLGGATKHKRVSTTHTFIMDDPSVIKFTTNYIAGNDFSRGNE